MAKADVKVSVGGQHRKPAPLERNWRKSFEESRDDKKEPITAQALLAVEAQAGIVNDEDTIR